MNIPLPDRSADGSYTTPAAGMAIDGDGCNGASSAPVYAPKGFNPDPLDHLANAGGPGDWYGVVTDSNGNPVTQGPNDPMPGAYVSATSYMHKGFGRRDPRAQAKGVVLGCRAEVHDTKTGKTVPAVVADFGPKAKLGEASISCAREFGVNPSPKNGGTEEKRFIYKFFPGQAAPGFELQPMG